MNTIPALRVPSFSCQYSDDVRRAVLPGSKLTLETLLNPNNSFTFTREDNGKRIVLRIDMNLTNQSWRVIRKQTILPQISPQQPPCVEWYLEKGRYHRKTNKSTPIKIPTITRTLQKFFVKNGFYLL